MRKYRLNRLEDETGVSGAGYVAEGYQYDSGICVMKWLTDTSSVAVYKSIEDVEIIHGHGGKTIVEWDSSAVSANQLPYWVTHPIHFFKDAVRGGTGD